ERVQGARRRPPRLRSRDGSGRQGGHRQGAPRIRGRPEGIPGHVRGRRALLPALAVLLLAACSVGPSGASPATVEIDIDLPLTGAQSADSTAALDQVRFVVQQTFGGKVEGLPIRLRVIDDSPAGRRDPVEGARRLSLALASPSLL